MMDAGDVDIAGAVGASPEGMTSTAKDQGAEVDEEGAGDGGRSEENHRLLNARRGHGTS
jgi:hypothetical protein